MLADERILSRTALHFESFLRNLLCRRAGDLRPLDDRDWSERGGRGDRRGRHVRFLARRRDGGGRSRCDIVVVLRGGELWLPSTARLERDGLRSDLQRLRPGADRLRKARRDRARVVLRTLDRVGERCGKFRVMGLPEAAQDGRDLAGGNGIQLSMQT